MHCSGGAEHLCTTHTLTNLCIPFVYETNKDWKCFAVISCVLGSVHLHLSTQQGRVWETCQIRETLSCQANTNESVSEKTESSSDRLPSFFGCTCLISTLIHLYIFILFENISVLKLLLIDFFY